MIVLKHFEFDTEAVPAITVWYERNINALGQSF